MIRSLVSTIILAVVFVGCGGDGIGPESGTRVTIAFTAGSSAAQTSGAQAGPSMVPAAGHPDRLEGDNGILTFTGVWMIVEEFKLEEAEGSCTLEPDMHCHDFEAPPTFIQLPMDGGIVEVVTEAEVPDGSYDELEFEVDDVLDEDDDADLIAAVRQQIEDAAIDEPDLEDWPDKASMLIVGSFQATDGPEGDPMGAARPFRVYFDAKIEIEIEFDKILEIPNEDDDVMITVDVMPDVWFVLPDEKVLDLSQFDFDETMELLKFEFEFEDDHHGFELEIEIG